MKLRDGFIVHNRDTESLLVPSGNVQFAGLVKGNKTLGAILDLLKTDTTEDEIIAAMKARFDAPTDVISRDVKKAISELNKIGALDE